MPYSIRFSSTWGKMADETAKFISSMAIIGISTFVLYQACHRASTIYLFELDTHRVIFIERIHALLFPLILSLLTYMVYLGTKKMADAEAEKKERQIINEQQAMASRRASRCGSRLGSRKTSINYQQDEHAAEQMKKLTRLLSDIEENDTMQSETGRRITNLMNNVPEDKKVEEPIPKTAEEKVEEKEVPRSRFYLSKVNDDDLNVSSGPTEWPGEDDVLIGGDENCDVYDRFGELDFWRYILCACHISMTRYNDGKLDYTVQISDVAAKIFAETIPIWICVIALYVVLLEAIDHISADFFYYHVVSVELAAILLAISCGILHYCIGKWYWITNNILAFSSIYIMVSRFQPISYQTSVVFIAGMAIYDLFWLYMIDLLSTITKESHAPLMIMIPRDLHGTMQKLATLDIMIPGIFLNLVLKYSSMYDGGLFSYTFYSVMLSLITTTVIAIKRQATTPAMVLPAIICVSVSLLFSSHPADLWKFMIRH